jgi:hypothetical protein
MLQAIIKIIQRQYYRYTLMTGIYMLGFGEAAMVHALLFVVFLFLVNYTFASYLFFVEFLKSSPTFSSILSGQEGAIIS